MKYMPHLLFAAVVALATLVGVSQMVVANDGGRGESLAHWLLFEMRRSEALQQRLVEISHTMEVKKIIIGDLLAERLTFREAIEAFREADEAIDQSPHGLIPSYRTPQTEAEVRQQVIAWAASELDKDTRQAEEILQRLESRNAECRMQNAE